MSSVLARTLLNRHDVELADHVGQHVHDGRLVELGGAEDLDVERGDAQRAAGMIRPAAATRRRRRARRRPRPRPDLDVLEPGDPIVLEEPPAAAAQQQQRSAGDKPRRMCSPPWAKCRRAAASRTCGRWQAGTMLEAGPTNRRRQFSDGRFGPRTIIEPGRPFQASFARQRRGASGRKPDG